MARWYCTSSGGTSAVRTVKRCFRTDYAAMKATDGREYLIAIESASKPLSGAKVIQNPPTYSPLMFRVRQGAR